MKKRLWVFALICLLATAGTNADETIDDQVIASIKMEGFQNSQLMETAFYLTEVHGPRLHGTESMQAAAEWSRTRLAEWGLENAHLESWELEVPGWELESYSVELIEPRYLRLASLPMVWTPGTAGIIEGVPVAVEVENEEDFEKYRGKLRGAIVMNGAVTPSVSDAPAAARRLDDDALGPMVRAMVPGEPAGYWEELEEWYEEFDEITRVVRFFREEGVSALLVPSSRANGIVRGTYSGLENPQENAPTFVIDRESFNMLARLIDKGFEPTLRLESRVTLEEGVMGHNVIAEIPGSDPDLQDEVVMIGGHLDAWHAGNGATDNAAGCAVAMEAMRILSAIDAKPRRTIRIALWDGEELDYSGSTSYVSRHFADLETMQLKPDHSKLSAYYNIDSGTGKIRGVYLQGNEWVRPIFEAFLAPFHYLGADTLTTQNTTGTDHLLFDVVGLPAFTFIQDPLDYETATHHSDLDVYDLLSEEDLKQAAVIMASFAYHTAMRDDLLPRKGLPPPRSDSPSK